MSIIKKKMEDRISLLPDCLLHNILSSLNTQQVVQTCVLSKRWKTLWTHIPVLDFCSSHHKFKSASSERERDRFFKRFIFRVLSEHCCTQMQKLRYSDLELTGDNVLVEFLICYARCRNVKELYIDSVCVDDDVYYWKNSFSACSSLTVLSIICEFTDNWVWGALVLPSLKILEIESIWEWESWEKNDQLEMFSGCPNLESLVLIDFCFRSARICAPKLSNFELCVSLNLSSPNLELLAPNLKSVKFSNILPIVTSALEFP